MDPFESNFKIPHHYVTVDTIELGNEAQEVIHILKDVDNYYALFTQRAAIGPCKSQEELLKKVIQHIAKNADRLNHSINKIEDIINALYLDK